MSPRATLIGRQRERERVERLVEAARGGRSGALLVHGDPGIGKTAVLDYAREAAGDGFRVVTARGIETESEIPFAGLWDLLSPLLDLRERLPPAQAGALGQALALEATGTPARFAVPAAVLSLFSVAAEEQPLLVLVDDVQWLDDPSAEAVVFAARRLHSEGVALVLSMRDGTGRDFDPVGIERLHVGPLEDADAAELLRRAHGESLAGTVAGDLVAAAAGNPLALMELPRGLSDAQRRGRDALPPVLPAGRSVEAAFRSQLAALPEDTQRALVVAAATDGGEELSHLAAALEHLDLADRALEVAERGGLVLMQGGRVRFRHPLLRAAAYHAATPGERRAAHRALAETAPEGAASRAWHLAAGVSAADESVARDLEDAANDARRRGGHGSAARAFTRAAELTPQPSERARRLLEAAIDHVAAGALERAEAEARTALPHADEMLLRTGLERILGHVMMRSGRPREGVEAMVAAAAPIESEVPPLAAAMLLEAGLGTLLTGPAVEAERMGAKARTLSGGVELIEGVADVLIAQAISAQGRVADAEAIVSDRERFLFEVDPPPGVHEAIATAAHAAMWNERFDRAQRILDRLIESARSDSAMARLCYPLCIRGQLMFRRGRWTEGLADIEEATQASRETGQDSILTYALQMLAELSAATGRLDLTRKHANESLRLARESGSPVFGPYARAALGMAAAVEEDFETAAREYEQAIADLHAIGMPSPGDRFWTAELVEVRVRAGDPDAARGHLATLERLVTEDNPPVDRAVLLRSRALVTEGDDAIGLLHEALAVHAESHTPFERARTELALGQRLRRGRTRDDARKPLRDALDTFERLAARPWADRARNELRASGASSARGSAPVAEVLTPHELQVAMIVARGATNKEAAASLFVSPKTVEHHLGQIYKKLELRSRTELTALLSDQLGEEAA